MNDLLSSVREFLGRLHPVVLHLPIGFLVALAVVEVAAGWNRFKAAAGGRVLLAWLSGLSALVAAGCGWLLAWGGEYAGEAFDWHKWLGTALVPIAFILIGLVQRPTGPAYRICLGLALVLVTVAGHHGGSLVRGSDYLFAPFKQPAQRAPVGGGDAGNEIAAYAALIQPVLNEYCVSCHGPEKVKGKLRLDSAAHLFVGGDTGPAIRPGSARESLLVQRLHLPADEDEHMPPGEKKQPSAKQIALLEWWINAGASTNRTFAELRPPEAP